MNSQGRKFQVGVIGTGFIGRGLILALNHYHELEVSYVLTRRQFDEISDESLRGVKFTADIQTVIDNSDLVVECSGDVIHGTATVEKVLRAGLPVVTMNSELQIVSGTVLSRLGKFVEAEGDQPGSLAVLNEEVKAMGFKPLVFGNIKRFLNINPTPEEMAYWSKRQGISLTQVTAFTDGTKLQIEQALVANALKATIACRNLSGINCANIEDGANRLAEIAAGMKKIISDYVLCPTGPAGIFIVATHDCEQKPYLEYLKLGPGPYYVITKPFHLCHLEIPKTILRILNGTNNYNFNNGQNPTVQVASITKRIIEAGEKINRGLGGFDIRGEAVKIADYPNAVPIGLLANAEFIKKVDHNKMVTFADVKLPPSLALEMWQQTLKELGYE
ncbi:MAG: NAD(P)-dependent oxidoreductase [Patescibacteria group bacterium]|nr:NAD(P)-dependent oxidoreductase [Patescibacteria group bacterium]